MLYGLGLTSLLNTHLCSDHCTAAKEIDKVAQTSEGWDISKGAWEGSWFRFLSWNCILVSRENQPTVDKAAQLNKRNLEKLAISCLNYIRLFYMNNVKVNFEKKEVL